MITIFLLLCLQFTHAKWQTIIIPFMIYYYKLKTIYNVQWFFKYFKHFVANIYKVTTFRLAVTGRESENKTL